MAHKGLDVFWELCVYVTAVLVEAALFSFLSPCMFFFCLFYLLRGKNKVVSKNKEQSCRRHKSVCNTEEKKKWKMMSQKAVKGHLERERKERDGSWQEKETVCRFACIKSRRLRASSQYRHIHTQIYTQMHSDNPSALAKCCLIQPDLHSTEKANSLPLTVWKTERSSHKWQRSELPRLYVCVCVFVYVSVPAGMHTCTHSTAHVFIFGMIFFFSVSACVYMYWWWQALQQYPLHCVTGR